MRSSILVLVLASGCVVGDAPEPPATIDIRVDETRDVLPGNEPTTRAPDRDRDICALAANLAADNVCSLMCDPPAMADALLAEGMRSGACYQLHCELPGGAVSVGVCLPPPS